MSHDIGIEYDLDERELQKALSTKEMERPILLLFSFEWPNLTSKTITISVDLNFTDLKDKYGVKLIRHDYFFMSIGFADFDFLILAYTTPQRSPNLQPDSVTVYGPDEMEVLDGFTFIHNTGNIMDFGTKKTDFGKGFDLKDKHLVDVCMMSGLNNSGNDVNLIIGSRLYFNYYEK